MKSKTRQNAVVFDLEFTAWEGSLARGWSAPGERREIVQIGALRLDTESLKIVDELEILVRPRLNPLLSGYFAALTGIGNDALRSRGVDFVTAYRVFLDFTGESPTWAFGRDDLILAENLKLYGMSAAMPLPAYTDVRAWFAANGVDLAGKHACAVAAAAGAEFSGRKHDALDDARSVAAGIAALVAQGAPNPFAPPQGRKR